jgi:beta-barrel assembly-enhancing protease
MNAPYQYYSARTIAVRMAALVLICLLCAGPAFALTIEEEKKLGKEFYDKIEKAGYLDHNPRVENYVAQIGNRILAHGKPLFDFRFSVIKSSGVNAFATPGGYVYVYRGLINLVEMESELAGVLAHEIAHVNARHIADIVDKSKKVDIAALVGILAGAFLGGGGQASAAIAAMSMATAAHLNLKYSREHEEEADRMGMSYLVQTGYDGQAILDFLKIMRRYEFYSSAIPSYFLTHPGTDERIRYLDGLLQTTYRQRGKESITGGLKRVQAVLALENKNLDATLRKYQDDLKKSPGDVDIMYGLALIQEKMGLISPALESFQKALKLSPEDQDIVRDTGIAYFRAGYPGEAVKLLQKAYQLNENDENTTLYLARSHEAAGDMTAALELYRRLETKKIEDADIYYNIAMAYGKTDHPGESHYNFGIFFKKKKKKDSALFHFRAALPYFPKDSERAQEIEKEISSLKK